MMPWKLGLVPQILIGVLLGALVGMLFPELAKGLGILGQLFVAMLKAVAPLLVLVLVMSAIANRHETGSDGRKTMREPRETIDPELVDLWRDCQRDEETANGGT